MRGVVVISALATGCFSPSPQAGAPCNNNGDCPSGLECAPSNTCEKPAGDHDSGIDAPDACPDTACNGDVLTSCSMQVTCAYGCGGSTPHCLELAPSNGLTTALLNGATADVTLDKLSFDGSDGSIRMMNTDVRGPGTGSINGIRFDIVNGVAVWTANSWNLAAGSDWTFTATRPMALFAGTTIRIASGIDVGGTGATAGPGGLAGSSSLTPANACLGHAGRTIDANHAEGGGGGGGAGGTKGGDGGMSNQGGTFTGVGGTCTTRPSTIPLIGGNGGGHGGQSGSSPGGGGGGAFALVAMESITITSTGFVAAPGGGGGAASGNAGGGGGSGGAVLIEAPTVTIQGQLTANGGGGGAPGGGTAGQRGNTTTSVVASGGTYSGSGGPAKGGNGAANSTLGTNGQSYNFDDTTNMVNFNRGGGGGGGYGKIEVKRKVGGVAGLASPAATITDAMFR